MTTPVGLPRQNRKLAWGALLLLTLASLAIVLAPVWIIQPFRPQSAPGVALAYALRRWSPLLTTCSLLFALALAVWLWRRSRRWWQKLLLVVISLPLPLTVWFARQNHFEWMFNPLANAQYARAADAPFVADNDVVMAVVSNGEAAAYPIRLMAYHHLVADTVGGTPIVATY